MAVWVCKEEIILDHIENVTVIFLYVSKRLAYIDALAKRDYKIGCMGNNLRAVPTPSKVTALGFEFNVPSSHF